VFELPLAIVWLIVLLAVSLLVWLAFRLGERYAHRSAGELATLNEIGHQLLRSQLSVDELCGLVYREAGRLIPTTFFQLGLFEGDTYQVKVWVRNGERLPQTDFPGGGSRGIVGWVRESGQALIVSDYEAERHRLPAFPDFDLDIEAPPRSGLFVPLVAGSSTIGVIVVQSHQAGRFSEDSLRLLTLLANQAAWAIRNARLYEHAQYRAEQLKLVGTVTAQVSAVQPLPDLFHQIVTLIKETFGYYSVSIFVFEKDRLQVGASTSEELVRQYPQVEPGIGMVGWAAKQGQTALANNVASDPRYRRLGVLPETRSEIALPLKVEDRVLGVLDVQSDRVGAFSEEDVSLLDTLAAQVALAIEQAQTYDAEHRLAQRLEALTQVSRAVVSVLELDDLLDQVVDLISDTFGFERVHIFVYTGGKLVFRAGAGPHSVRWLIDELAYGPDDPGLIPKVARTGIPELVGDVHCSEDYRPGPGLEDTRSELAVPIKMAEHVLGVIDLQSEIVDAFSREDLMLMQSLADSVAVAIRNATLYANERRRRVLSDALREIGATLVSDLDLDHVLKGILDGLGRLVPVDTAGVALFETNSDQLILLAASGLESEALVGQPLPLDTTHEGEDPRELVRKAYCQLLSLAGERACVVAPLAVSGRLIGYLIADHQQAGRYTQNDEEFIGTFASQAALAINNARLYAAQQAEAYVTTALLQISEAVNTQIEMSEALDTVARLTTLLSGVNHCLVLRWEENEAAYYLSAQCGARREQYEEMASKPFAAGDYPFLDLLSVADRPLGAGEGHQLPIPEPLMRLMDASSILAFPLRVKRGLIGLLIVDDAGYGRPLDSRLLNILTGVAHQTALVLETAALQSSAAERDRLERELDVARDIQATFIPESPPRLPGWQLAAAWRAARQVSGDFYDFIPLRDGLWGLVVADVADKGIPAALFMAMCRTLLRAAAMSRTSPAATLIRVNELLFNDSRSDLFVTAFYAVWDPASGRVAYASAGHNPPLLVRCVDGRVVELHSRGIALGVINQIDIEEHQITLQPGDVLVAYTDGVTEAMQADYTEWGIDRLRATLESTCAETAEAMLENILSAIDEFVGDAPQNDDMTLWLLKREME